MNMQHSIFLTLIVMLADLHDYVLTVCDLSGFSHRDSCVTNMFVLP